MMEMMLLGLCLNATCAHLETKAPKNLINLNSYSEEDALGKRERMHFLAKELKGKHLKVATLKNYPLNYAIHEDGRLVGKGVAFQFLEYMREKYEFTYSVVEPQEEILGSNVTGIFGMLYNNEADVAAAFLPVIPSYWGYVQYSASLDEGEWVVLMKRPAESATGSGLLAPFTLGVWLLILASLLLVGPIIYALIQLHRRLCTHDAPTVYSMYACVWFVYGALLKQGTTLNPGTDSSRLLFATWWIFITILTAFYTANLTAFLTLSQFTLPVSTPNDLGEKRYSWVTNKGNAIEEAATNELEELYQNLRGSMPHYVQEGNDKILQYYVKEKNFMYVGEKPIVEHMMFQDYLDKTRNGVIETDRCTFVITTWSVLLRSRAFAYSKDFPYSEIFNDVLQHMVESGIVKHFLRQGLPNTQICPLNLGSKERQLRNSDLLLTYFIVGAGFLISGLVFLSEIAFKLYQKSCEVHVEDEQPDYLFAPPPSYQTLFGPRSSERKEVNGREYWVVRNREGEPTLIPMRTPSALLFQYAH